MPTDPRIDAYIGKQAEFARPILTEIRARVHAACPEVEEALKWSMPGFVYRGKILAVMASFKAHATLAVWRRAGEVATTPAGRGAAMGQYGKLRSVADLPAPAALEADLHAAMALIAAGARTAMGEKREKGPAPDAPPDLLAALDTMPGARAGFEALPPGARREYVEWVLAAKRPATREKRVATTAEQAAAGRKLNWKYEAC